MWISEPMPVTTRIISVASGSRRSVKGTEKSPDVNQVKTVCSMTRPSAGAPKICAAEASEMPKATSIAATATPPETVLGSRRPNVALIRNPMNGARMMNSSIVVGRPTT